MHIGYDRAQLYIEKESWTIDVIAQCPLKSLNDMRE